MPSRRSTHHAGPRPSTQIARGGELRHRVPEQAFLDAIGHGILIGDGAGRITHSNKAATRMFGCRRTQLIGHDIGERLFDPSRKSDESRTFLVRLAKSGATGPRKLVGRRAEGAEFPVEAVVTRIGPAAKPVYVAALREALPSVGRPSSSRRAALFDATTQGIMIIDGDWRVETVNQAFTEITGYDEVDVVGRAPAFLNAGRAKPGLARTIARAVRASGRWDSDHRSLRKNGSSYAERLTVTGIVNDRGAVTGYVAAIVDVTERHQDEERIRHLANFDALTGLPNRNLFMDRLTQAVNTALRGAQRVAVMFIDLDGFKLVNDTFGHDGGDEVLRESARRLSANVRVGDTVARLGGDEFTVIMPNLPSSEPALVVAQRMVASIELPYRIGNQDALVSASIGIALYPDDGREVHTLVRNADAAMYQAKESGKAHYRFYTSDLNAQAAERMVIKAGLAKALKRHEFHLEYQPRKELVSGRLTGIEALLRWTGRDLGAVSPAKFLPVAEETGAIAAIGEWVVTEACRRQQHWRESGHSDLRVAINLSGRQLRQPNIVRVISELIAREGGFPGGIELEITEAMIERDADHAATTLKSLVAMGIRVTLDDFGAGSSSLGVLRRFPVDTIKIAQTLVRDIAHDSDSFEIVRAVIGMGHSLGRRVIAEGVETEQQERLLRELHCNEIQGYLISPPLSAEAIDELLAEPHRVVPV